MIQENLYKMLEQIKIDQQKEREEEVVPFPGMEVTSEAEKSVNVQKSISRKFEGKS